MKYVFAIASAGFTLVEGVAEMGPTMKCVCALMLCWSAAAYASQEPRAYRYWGEFEIANVTLTAEPLGEGMVPSLDLTTEPLLARAVVHVREAQAFDWEWVEISALGTGSLIGYPNVTARLSSADRTEASFELNRAGPNLWSSFDIVELAFSDIAVRGRYTSFNLEHTFEEQFQGEGLFPVVVSSVRFDEFPDTLVASVWSAPNIDGQGGPIGQELHPQSSDPVGSMFRWGPIRITQSLSGVFPRQMRLHHTPVGDTNNDGTVGFDDFVLLSKGFGLDREATWEDGDFNEDGDVDFQDFVGLSANFQRIIAEPVWVPEPSGWALMLASIVLLMRWERVDQAPAHAAKHGKSWSTLTRSH